MSEDVEKWWDDVSDGYQEDAKLGTDSVHYGPYAPNEEQLQLLGDITGKNILEIGCGGGQCSIAFAKKGANVIGIDISKEQVKYARKLAADNGVEVDFRKGDFHDLPIDAGSQDIVFTAFSLMYANDLAKVFREVNRVLKEEGYFVFSASHPFYFIIDSETHRIHRSYFDAGRKETIETWPDGTEHKFVVYQRKLSDIFNPLVESGFIVEQNIEPLDLHNKECTENVWEKIYPLDHVKLLGPTIIFKARKK